jgi:hypothetical protein
VYRQGTQLFGEPLRGFSLPACIQFLERDWIPAHFMFTYEKGRKALQMG